MRRIRHGEDFMHYIPRFSQNCAILILDVVHFDISGPLPLSSKEGTVYFVPFTVDKSLWNILYLIKVKFDCLESFKRFKQSRRYVQGKNSCARIEKANKRHAYLRYI